jgi:hypothetical protein
MHRVFAIQVLLCPRCAGPRRIVGAVTEPHAVRRQPGAAAWEYWHFYSYDTRGG